MLSRIFRGLRIFTSVAAVALLHCSGHAASFDCGGKLTVVEKMICVDPHLSALDDVMKALYISTKQKYPDAVLSQRDWLKFGRNRCTNSACLVVTYESRISQFKGGTFRNWATSNMPELAAAGAADIGVTYQKPTAGFGKTMEWLRQSRFLESNLAFAQTKYRYPLNLKVVGMNCGVPNAFYLSESETVAVCYELVDRLIQQFVAMSADAESTEQQRLARLISSMNFLIQHELGHAALHNRRAKRGMGNEESEADNFAFVNLISSSKTDADLTNMLYGVKYALDVFPQDVLSVEAMTDEHDLSTRRYFGFACLVAGVSNNLAQEFLKQNQFSQVNKLKKCQLEWRNRKGAVDSLLSLQGNFGPMR